MKYKKGTKTLPLPTVRVSPLEAAVLNNMRSPVTKSYPRKTHKRIDSYEFTKIWMTSNTLDDVCERLELSKQQAYSKANTLRKRGVKLPRMSRRLDKNSTEELNKLVERYAK